MSTAPILPAAALAAVMFTGGIIVGAHDYEPTREPTSVAESDGAAVAPPPLLPPSGGELIKASASAASHWGDATHNQRDAQCWAFKWNRGQMKEALASHDGGIGYPDGSEGWVASAGGVTPKQFTLQWRVLKGIYRHHCK